MSGARRPIFAWLISFTLALVGCSDVEQGPQRYQVSGQVTYQNQPVPQGYIEFEPDAEQGNLGPRATAEIRAGRYTTRADQGVVAGPQRVRIQGFAAPSAESNGLGFPSPLFPAHQLTYEMPAQDTEADFQVPTAHQPRE